MIYTVTFNPSLDYIINVDSFETGKINRTKSEIIYPGGKGINVSIVLRNLGHESTALGFTAGFIGEQIEKLLVSQGIKSEFIRIENGLSRINVKMKSDEETEINGQGPIIDDAAIEKLYKKLDTMTSDDILVLAGSIPSSMTESMYMDIMERIQEKKLRVVVDATKDLLVNVLRLHPFLIKPNNHELGEIFGAKIESKEQVIVYAKKLQEMGAVNVLVSMAGDGAVFVGKEGTVYQSEAPQGKVINSVGAGDSMVAGFLSGYLDTGDYEYAFKKSICAGSASAFSTELAKAEEVEFYLNLLK